MQEDVGMMAAELHKWDEECRRYILLPNELTIIFIIIFIIYFSNHTSPESLDTKSICRLSDLNLIRC
jgi:hypothetical protein